MTVIESHECELLSMCCGVGVAEYTDVDFGKDNVAVGFCGACHEGTGFECEQCLSDCTVPIESLYLGFETKDKVFLVHTPTGTAFNSWESAIEFDKTQPKPAGPKKPS